MKVLHLASWYPNKTGEQDGDFIQRHLRAISTVIPVHLIYVVKDQQLTGRKNKSVHLDGNLVETIVYYRPFSTGIRFIDKLFSVLSYKKAFKKEIQLYITEHGLPDLVHVHVAMRAGLAALWIKRKFRIPYVLSEHWSGYYETDPDNYFLRDKLFKFYTAEVFANASWITAVSADLGKRLSDIFAVSKTSVIFNVVNTHLFRYDPLKHDPFHFIHISNMHPIKNLEGIFRVLSKLNEIRSDWRITVVGIIDPVYQQLAFTLGLNDHIRWRGSIDHTEVPAEIRGSDALLMFSNHENLSCVVCESLCCGLPVIATSVGGLPEIVNDSNGKLVKPGDEAALLKEILKLMDEYNHYNRPKIAADGAKLFNEPLIASQFVSIYRGVLNHA
jgi:glycosyltransferase involved in cell wall biosynthesis